MVTVIGKNVKKLASQKNIGKQQISEALNWSDKETNQFLTKGKNVTFPETKALAALLGVTTGELLTRPKPSSFGMPRNNRNGEV